MHISKGTPTDLDAAINCMVVAFRKDALLRTFFADSAMGRDAASGTFFGLLLEARLALGMPVLLAHEGADLIGVAMGYDTAPPVWPEGITARWDRLIQAHPAFAGQLAAYDHVVDAADLTVPHYVLGVLAVRPDLHGKGVGKALILAFLDLSDQDPASQGTALETANPDNLLIYDRFGFGIKASGPLGPVTLWSMFRPKPDRKEPQ
jgi:GNAT superfamily N-acetyltransferase